MGYVHGWNKKTTATVILVLLAVACGSPFDAEPTTRTNAAVAPAASTTVTIARDSEWQVPSDFSVVLPFTYKQLGVMLANDVGDPPDMPAFSMTRDSEVGGELKRVVIVVYSDGVSTGSVPREVLTSWTEESIVGAEFDAILDVNWDGLQMATWRGQAQGPGQNSPQGVIAAVIYDFETHKVWRLLCAVSSLETSDEAARICDQVQAEFRPQ